MSNEDEVENFVRKLLTIYSVDLDSGIITHRLSRGGGSAGMEAGCINQDGYRRIRVGKKFFVVHRVIWLVATGRWPKDQIDHINGVRTDNRLCNLRPANNSQNQQNRPSRSWGKSGLRGVTVLTSGRYQARIKADGGYVGLGSYETAELAHEAYLQAKKIYHPFSPNVRDENEQ